MKTSTFSVVGMTCGSCVRHISDALRIDGVDKVEVRLSEGTVTVVHDDAVPADHIATLLENAGYPATRPSASPPRAGCCCGPRA